MFVVMAYDRPLVGRSIRRATRSQHLEHVERNIRIVSYGGAILDDAGDMVGTVTIYDVSSRAKLDAILHEDPYTKAGLFERIVIHPCTQMLPERESGRLKQEILLARKRAREFEMSGDRENLPSSTDAIPVPTGRGGPEGGNFDG